jgi:hypothetical protein
MPNPTKSDVHVNHLLGNVSVATILKADMFVAADLAPIVPVEFKSDRYAVYDKGDWLRDEALPRAAGTESAGGGYDVDTTPNYSCVRYSFHKDVDDETANNSDKPINMDKDATKFVTQKMLLKRERLVMSSLLNTGIWANEKAGVASGPTASQFLQWDAANSHPLVNVEVWKELIGSVIGFDPNVMLISPNVLACLKNHVDVKDYIFYNFPKLADYSPRGRRHCPLCPCRPQNSPSWELPSWARGFCRRDFLPYWRIPERMRRQSNRLFFGQGAGVSSCRQ